MGLGPASRASARGRSRGLHQLTSRLLRPLADAHTEAARERPARPLSTVTGPASRSRPQARQAPCLLLLRAVVASGCPTHHSCGPRTPALSPRALSTGPCPERKAAWTQPRRARPHQGAAPGLCLLLPGVLLVIPRGPAPVGAPRPPHRRVAQHGEDWPSACAPHLRGIPGLLGAKEDEAHQGREALAASSPGANGSERCHVSPVASRLGPGWVPKSSGPASFPCPPTSHSHRTPGRATSHDGQQRGPQVRQGDLAATT